MKLLIFAFAVFGSSVAEIINLSHGKDARQVSTDGEAVAGRAVDGDSSQHWRELSCARTEEETDPWWAVDLGKTYNISRVVIYNRKDTGAARLHDVQIAGSDNESDFRAPFRGGLRRCAHEEGQVRDVTSFYCSSRFEARYIIIMIKSEGGIGTDVLTLCEVEVFGEELSN